SHMLYQFPPPVAFESSTTSNFIVAVILWSLVIGLPASVFACLIRPVRSVTVLYFGMAFWAFALLLPWTFLFSWYPNILLRDQSPLAVIAAISFLAILPLPAIAAGWQELERRRGRMFGFSDVPAWGCALPIGFLLAATPVLLPTGNAPHDQSASICKSQLKQLGLIMHNFHDQHGKLPDSQIRQDRLPAHSWRIELLPFLDHKALFDTYDQKSSWDAASNLPLAKTDVRSYGCPAVPLQARQDSAGRLFSAYATLIGPDSPFPNGKGMSLKQFSDGTSYTAIVAEACGRQIVWTEPKDIEVTATNIGVNLPGNKPDHSPGIWSSYHKGRVHTLFGDGSVRALNADTDPRVLRAITTANGGEEVGDF
ncbi:MAG: hypothetical protein JWN70_5420, partial [Planctomycetaceae bacterium]|nr:hypothetical protein [Planctomycetaceae bacterium]